MGNIFVENYKKMSDEEIVSEIRGGNYEPISLILKRYEGKIGYYVSLYCDEADREDAAQEAGLALYGAVMSYDGSKSSFATFASLCIKRSMLDRVKRAARKKNIPPELVGSLEGVNIPDCNSPEKIFFDNEAYRTLTESIKLELSYTELSVLRLFLDGKRYIDIADKLGITEKAVSNALTRIRRKLKDKQRR